MRLGRLCRRRGWVLLEYWGFGLCGGLWGVLMVFGG